MEVESIIVLIITLAIITVTVIIVVLEFKKVKKNLVHEEELSRANENVLTKNIQVASTSLASQFTTQQSALRNDMHAGDSNIRVSMAAANSNIYATMFNADSNIFKTLNEKDYKILSEMASADSALTASMIAGDKKVYDETMAYATTQDTITYSNISASLDEVKTTLSTAEAGINKTIGDINSRLDRYMFSASNQNMLRASGLSLGGGSMAYTATNGITFANTSNSAVTYDLTAGKANIQANLKVGATAEVGKVKLGQKWLMSGTGDGHADDSWLRLMNVNGTNYHGGFAAGRLWTPDLTVTGPASIGGNLNMTGSLNFARNNASYMLGVDGTGVFLRGPNVTMRDNANTARLAVSNTGVGIAGTTNATGDISSQSRVCVKNVCLTDTDITKLKATLSNASP